MARGKNKSSNSRKGRQQMSYVELEKTISLSNVTAAIEELLHRLGELGEDDKVELPWKVQQIPLKIHKLSPVGTNSQTKEVIVRRSYGKRLQKGS
jgi:DNA integrity scanning protein DisA with diadenylate cyclase activity